MRLLRLETDDAVPDASAAQVDATGGDAGQSIEEQAAAAGIDPATLVQAQAEAES